MVFGKFQLHSEEGESLLEFDMSELTNTAGTHANHNIAEGTECVVQGPPAASLGASSGGLKAATSKTPKETASSDDSESEDEEPKAKRAKIAIIKPQTGKKSKQPIMPKSEPPPRGKAAKATKAAAAKAAKVKPESKSSPSTKVQSTIGGRRFTINESSSEEKFDETKLLQDIAALTLENA